ncbi:DUF7344 domain-containing protein [Haloarchaeobius amylolyticus]|uniref:DUF7344 domain-containing protein n=1 Tax=Haloarchaeobius amylolyticus TaxID=1198296 RepID=UPI003F636208
MPAPETEQIISTLYHAFRATRRRLVVQILGDSDRNTIPTRELARRIASIEQNTPTNHATGEPYRNVYNALSQTHLPTLADAGIVIYDPKRQTVSRGPRYPLAAILLAINEPAIKLLTDLSIGYHSL